MKLLKLLRNTFNAILKSLRRFPITIALTASVSVMLIIISELTGKYNHNTIDTLQRITMIILLGIPVSLSLKFIFERFEKGLFKVKLAVYAAAAAALILYYFIFLKDLGMVSATRLVGLNIVFYLTALFIPYYYKKEHFELYVIKLITGFFITILYSLVLEGGISAILFTIDKLLGVYVYNKLYYYVGLCIAGIFAPSYFLSGVPEYKAKMQPHEYSKVLKVLFLYIVMPLISIYTLILYIYFAKIVFTLQWPNGMVGNLVLWYSLISTAVIFLVWPLKCDNKWVNIFITWFTKVVLPLIIIMFLSLGIRIRSYGITENRYYVIILGIFVFGTMMYWNMSKVKRNIILPVTLAVLTLISVAGPLSAYKLSIYSQNKRFETILKRNNMLEQSKIIKTSSEISKQDKVEISAIISYFKNSHTLNDMKCLPYGFKIENMKNIFGFDFEENSYQGKNQYFSYTSRYSGTMIDIKDYDYLFSFRQMGKMQNYEPSAVKADYDMESHKLKIYNNNSLIYDKDLSHYIEKLFEKYGINQNNEISQSDMIFTDENEKIKVKIIIFNAYGNKDFSNDKLIINSIDFDAAAKLK